MKKTISCLIILLIFFGSSTIHAKNPVEEINKSKEELEKIENNVVTDVINTLNINTTGFKKYSFMEAAILVERDSTLIELLKLSEDLQSKGYIGANYIYLKQNRAFIVGRDVRGVNLLVNLKKVDNRRWEPGKIIKK
ncbi:hypothetical protein NVV31_23160 [Cytobacillus firmus]|uniref:hypothetical protein n=1 Tax=Cytobacillus firmus TaxID=1399 RepID=UPI0021C88518|nr:hypothetical protein [Cytobacillus firmus]MCU1808274.1 hypothetical protein [Cytobacillus firmus]